MTYTIIYHNNDGEQGSEPFNGKFSEVQAFAEDAVGTGQFERIEILDADGIMRWHRPRTVRAAT